MRYLLCFILFSSFALWAQDHEMEELENIDSETGTSQKRIGSAPSDDHEEVMVEPQNQEDEEDNEEEMNDDDY